MYKYILWVLIIIIFIIGVYTILREPKTHEDKYKDHKNRQGAMMIGVSIVLGAILYYYTNVKKYHATMPPTTVQRHRRPDMSRNVALERCTQNFAECNQHLDKCNSYLQEHIPKANALYADYTNLQTQYNKLRQDYESQIGPVYNMLDPVDDDLANLFGASKI